jgi:trk system potassium uptake protein TrkH
MGRHVSGLIYTVRPRVVLKYLGQLLLAAAVLTLIPLAASIYFRDPSFTTRFAAVVAAQLLIGGACARIKAPTNVQTNEAMVIAALIFLISAGAMTYPMMAAELGLMDAIFEAVSGVTTTGLTTCAGLSMKPHSFLFARAWMQWYGGLGILVLSLAFFVEPGLAARRLSMTQYEEHDLLGGMKSHARLALIAYTALTIACIILVRICGVPTNAAITYGLAAISTGGFAPADDSLMPLGPTAQAVLIAFGLLGAISFVFYRRLIRGDRRVLREDRQATGLIAAWLLTSVLLSLALCKVEGNSWGDAWWHGMLNGASAQSTTGFSTLDVRTLSPASLAVLILSMLIGGSAGSTAGGLKVLRFLVLLRVVQMAILRAGATKHAVLVPRLGKRLLEPREISDALAMLGLLLGANALVWLVFLMYGFDPLSALFDVVSATGTVGLSTGVVSGEMPGLLKGLVCLNMLCGRLEFFPVIVLLRPRTWLGKKGASV